MLYRVWVYQGDWIISLESENLDLAMADVTRWNRLGLDSRLDCLVGEENVL